LTHVSVICDSATFDLTSDLDPDVSVQPLNPRDTANEPFEQDESLPREQTQLTWRAVLIGSLLGLIVGASNIYLGLKTGFSFGASLFG
jgi:hypothetical protein